MLVAHLSLAALPHCPPSQMWLTHVGSTKIAVNLAVGAAENCPKSSLQISHWIGTACLCWLTIYNSSRAAFSSAVSAGAGLHI